MNPVLRERRMFLFRSIGGYASQQLPPPVGSTLAIDVYDLVVTGATNASPIVITTNANHNRATGDKVTIAGVGGNTAANGDWVITVLSDTTFSLDSSTGNGAYTSGGTGVHDIDETEIQSKEIWATGSASSVNFQLVGPPNGFSITPAGTNTGGGRHRATMTCQPPEQGSLPKTVWVTVRATDGTNTADRVIKFHIGDLNHAPEVWDETNVVEYFANVDQQLSILFIGRDQDIPAQTLTFSLDATAGPYPNIGQVGYDGTPEGDAIPSNAAISSAGRLTWIPDTAGVKYITVRVTDNGTGTLSAIWTIKVTVQDPISAGDCTATLAAPSADATASSENAGNEVWKAFDKNTSTYWQHSGTLPEWMKYRFSAAAVRCRYFTIRADLHAASFVFEGSNDDAVWTTLLSKTGQNLNGATGEQVVWDTKNRELFEYYRLTITADLGTPVVYELAIDCSDDAGDLYTVMWNGSSPESSNLNLVRVSTVDGSLTNVGTISGFTGEMHGFCIDYQSGTGATIGYVMCEEGSNYVLRTINLFTGAVGSSIATYSVSTAGELVAMCFNSITTPAPGRITLLYRRAGYVGLVRVELLPNGTVIDTVEVPYDGEDMRFANSRPRGMVCANRRSVVAMTGRYPDNKFWPPNDGSQLEENFGAGLWQIDDLTAAERSSRVELLDADTFSPSAYPASTSGRMNADGIAAMTFRDTYDTTERFLYLIEGGNTAGRKIWKKSLWDGAVTEVTTFDGSTYGYVLHADAMFRVPFTGAIANESAPINVFEISTVLPRSIPVGGRFAVDTIVDGKMVKDILIEPDPRYDYTWQLIDVDTQEVVDSQTVDRDTSPLSWPLSRHTSALPVGALAAGTPETIINRRLKLLIESVPDGGLPVPFPKVTLETPWFRYYHEGYLVPAVSAKVVRGGMNGNTFYRQSEEDAPSLINPSLPAVTYTLGVDDWIEIELDTATEINFLRWEGGTMFTASSQFRYVTKCAVSSAPVSLPFQTPSPLGTSLPPGELHCFYTTNPFIRSNGLEGQYWAHQLLSPPAGRYVAFHASARSQWPAFTLKRIKIGY